MHGNIHVVEDHQVDAAGNPAGGTTVGLGLTIKWQDGPRGNGLNRVAPNGAQVEDVLEAAIGRLLFFQISRFACVENAVAIDDIGQALASLRKRTAERAARGVEGTHHP